MEVGLRDLDVVAEDLVEADLQRVDAGAFAFALFHGGDDLFAVLAEVAEFVEFGVIVGADDAGVGGERGRLVGDGALEAFADVGEFVDFVVEAAEEVAAAFGWGGEEILEDGELGQGFAEGDEFARAWRGPG